MEEQNQLIENIHHEKESTVVPINKLYVLGLIILVSILITQLLIINLQSSQKPIVTITPTQIAPTQKIPIPTRITPTKTPLKPARVEYLGNKPTENVFFKDANDELHMLKTDGSLIKPLSNSSKKPVYVTDYDISPDGNFIAYGSGAKNTYGQTVSNKIGIYNIENQKDITLLKTDKILWDYGIASFVGANGIRFSHDGKILGVISEMSVYLYDTTIWKELEKYQLPKSRMNDYRSLLFSPDDSYIGISQVTSPESFSSVIIDQKQQKVTDLAYDFGGAQYASGVILYGFTNDNNLVLYERHWPQDVDQQQNPQPTVSKLYTADTNENKIATIFDTIPNGYNAIIDNALYVNENKNIFRFDFSTREKTLLLNLDTFPSKDINLEYLPGIIKGKINGLYYFDFGTLSDKDPYTSTIFEIQEGSEPKALIKKDTY